MNAHVDPTQLASRSTPASSSSDEPLTFWLHDLKSLNECLGGTAVTARPHHRDFTDRVLIQHLGHAAFKLMIAIGTRTLPFDKVAETVPHEQLTNGLRQSTNDKDLVKTSLGYSVFEGTGLTRNSIRSGLKDLYSKGITSSFTVIIPKTGPVTAYMPFSWRNLYIASADRWGSGFDRLLKMATERREIFDLITRPPVHELEEEYAQRFPDGLGVVRTIESTFKNDFRNVTQKRVMDALLREGEGRLREGQ